MLEVGNIDATIYWGSAEEYVEGMWRTLQADAPDTFVIATGCARSVRDFAAMAFESADIGIAWQGKAAEERAVAVATQQPVVRVSAEYHRPAEVELLVGDFCKADRQLGWRPPMGPRELRP